MIEAIGTDVMGICLDTGNFPMTLEDPLSAVRRVAPYAVATHLKDGVVTFAEDGLVYQARPCGEGLIPMRAILEELVHASPGLRTLSVEDHDGLFPIRIFRDEFVASFSDLRPVEFADVIRLAREGDAAHRRRDAPQPPGARSRSMGRSGAAAAGEQRAVCPPAGRRGRDRPPVTGAHHATPSHRTARRRRDRPHPHRRLLPQHPPRWSWSRPPTRYAATRNGFGEQYGISDLYADASDLLARSDIDAVDICAPPAFFIRA